MLPCINGETSRRREIWWVLETKFKARLENDQFGKTIFTKGSGSVRPKQKQFLDIKQYTYYTVNPLPKKNAQSIKIQSIGFYKKGV